VTAPPRSHQGAMSNRSQEPEKRRCSAGWGRLIAKLFHADPLTCDLRGQS
jgi:hypothetical protein